MEKEIFRCRRHSSDLYRNRRLQAEKVSVSFLGQQDLLLQELPMFPDCDRHHYSLHAVLCMHPPGPLFIHSCCCSRASQLSPDRGLTERQQLHQPCLPATFCNGPQERTGDRCTGADIERKIAVFAEAPSVSSFQREFNFLLLHGHAFC